MMKKFTIGGMVLMFAAFIGMVQFGSPAAFARSTAAAQMGQSQQSQHVQLPGKKSANIAMSNTPEAFLGTITRKNGNYVLTVGRFTYKLNEQSKLSKYDGAQVQIIGNLNPRTNKIKVQEIKKAGS